MSYTLRLLTTEARDLVVEALRAEAAKRTRVAQGAARLVATDKAAGRDVRPASVKVTLLLAEAGQLAALADELANTTDVPLVAPAPVAAQDPTPDDTDSPEEAAGVEATTDGLSEAAHAAMTQAEAYAEEYLADPDGTDVDTNALLEDEPTDDDVEEVLK